MNKIFFLIGLPGSGKSHWSIKQVKQHKDTVIVCRDSIRLMLRAQYANYDFNDLNMEPLTLKIAQDALRQAIKSDLNVILDETNLTRKIRSRWIQKIREICKYYKKPFSIIFVCFDSKHHLKYRMKASRGLSKRYWSRIITNMSVAFEPASQKEFYHRKIIVRR
ncbi:MAG: AAA family ATPase [Nitrosarchaeum sp.]|nr:AAA family ATPase [Nitrosarchaeum sp.]